MIPAELLTRRNESLAAAFLRTIPEDTGCVVIMCHTLSKKGNVSSAGTSNLDLDGALAMMRAVAEKIEAVKKSQGGS